MAMVLSPEMIASLRGKDAVQLGSVCTCLADLREVSAYPASQSIAQKPERPSKVDRKIEALFLHGRQSNDNLTNFQTNAFRSAIGKDVNITILEADMIWKYQPNHDLHDADDMVRTLSKGKPFYTWFDVSSDDPRERPYMWKFFDPKVKISYSEEAAKSVDKLLSAVSDGSYDVVMGLFEGCIVIHMAIAKLMELGRPIPWRLSVCFGAMPIRDEKYLGPLATRKADHPAVLVFGKTDQDYFYSRTNQCGMKPAEEYYSKVTVLEHDGGHLIPNQPPRSQEIYLRVLEEIKYYCGQGPKPAELSLPRRPTSWPLLTMTMMPRKLRVLSLCGGHSCEAVNKMQVAALKNALGPIAEWTYLVGSKVWEYYDGEPIPSDMEKMIAGKSPLYNWYLDKAHEGPGRLNRDKQFDPSVKVEYYDIPEVLEKFEKFLDDNADGESNPPFDVIVAFSQGCIMLHMLIGHLRKRQLKDSTRLQNKLCSPEEMPWRMSVMVSGMHVRDKEWQHLVDTPTKSTHPVIFVNGKADEYFDYARDGFGSLSQEEYYENPLVLNHEGSHEFPPAGPRATEIYSTIIDQIWYHCGGRLDSPPPAPANSGSAGGKFDLKAFLGPPPRKP